MTEKEKVRAEARAKILKSLAHPTRIFIVEKLHEKPHCVCELTDLIEADTSTVSKHLSILKNAGVLKDRKEGTTVYYSLTAPCVMNFIGCVETVIQANLQKQLKFFTPQAAE